MNPINFFGKGFRKFANIFWKSGVNSFDFNKENTLKTSNSTKSSKDVSSCEIDSSESSKTSILNYRLNENERSTFEDIEGNKTGLVVPYFNYLYRYYDPHDRKKKYAEKMSSNSINNRVCKVEISANKPSEDRCNALQLKNINGYFVAVFDGHGGEEVADYAKRELHKKFDENFKLLNEDNKILQKQKIILAIHKAFEEVVSRIN